MPLNWNNISAITLQDIVPELYDNYYKFSPVFYLTFKGTGTKDYTGGTWIQQPFVYAPLKGGSAAFGETFDISQVQNITAMTFNPKLYWVNVTIDEAQLAVNHGNQSVMGYVETQLTGAAQTMAQNLMTDFYLDGQGAAGGSPVTSVDGIRAAYDDGTNFPSYGNVSRALVGSGASSGINGYYINVNGTVSFPQIQTAYGQATFGPVQPNLFSTTQVVWNALWNKMVPAQRVMDNFGQEDTQNIGFRSFRFNGQRVVVDQYCPAGYFYGMDTNSLLVYISTQEQFAFGTTGFKELPNALQAACQLCYIGNIVVGSPRNGFVMAGITG